MNAIYYDYLSKAMHIVTCKSKSGYLITIMTLDSDNILTLQVEWNDKARIIIFYMVSCFGTRLIAECKIQSSLILPFQSTPSVPIYKSFWFF
jgi:hypothetical protein